MTHKLPVNGSNTFLYLPKSHISKMQIIMSDYSYKRVIYYGSSCHWCNYFKVSYTNIKFYRTLIQYSTDTQILRERRLNQSTYMHYSAYCKKTKNIILLIISIKVKKELQKERIYHQFSKCIFPSFLVQLMYLFL